MNKLVMLVGISQSGKTSLARQLRKIKEVDEVISFEDVKEELKKESKIQKIENEVQKRVINSLREGKNTCYDSINLSSRWRINFLNKLSDLDLNIEKECIIVLTSFEECIKRKIYNAREDITEESIKEQIKQFNCPYWYEGWDNIKIVCNTHVPLIWFMEQNKIFIDNSISISDHMLKARNTYDALYKKPWEESLFDAISYHDIGKYFCREEKNGKIEYNGHQNAGAYFYLLDCNNMNKKGLTDTLTAAVLIQLHNEINSRTNKELKELRDLIGETLYNNLIIMKTCDELAY